MSEQLSSIGMMLQKIREEIEAPWRAQVADLLEALRACVEVIEFREKDRDPSWDGSATPTSVVGIARDLADTQAVLRAATSDAARLRAALAEAERERDASHQSEDLARHRAGVADCRAERAEAERTKALADLMVANMDRVKLEADLAGARAQCRADIAAMQREIARAERAEASLAAAWKVIDRFLIGKL